MDPKRPTRFYAFCRAATKLYYRLYHRLKIVRVGETPPPEEGPLLVVANHSSDLDPPLLSYTMSRPMRFFAKAELFEGPKWFARLIEALGAYPVRRGGGDIAAFKASVKMLRDGNALMMFPEGTRTPDGELQEFADGCARMVVAVEGCRILPVRIRGSYEAFGRNRRLPRPHRIEVRIGEPFGAEALGELPADKKGLYRALTDLIFQRISAL